MSGHWNRHGPENSYSDVIKIPDDVVVEEAQNLDVSEENYNAGYREGDAELKPHNEGL